MVKIRVDETSGVDHSSHLEEGWIVIKAKGQNMVVKDLKDGTQGGGDETDFEAAIDAGEAPRVFLSHASEDKDRFVLPFAERLRARGLNVWVDRWEMHLGDSLVAKIFMEGLDRASAVVVVISKNSLNKPWVVEELDAAVVKRINGGSRLIPIVLDDLKPSEIPISIRHLLFESVHDLLHLDEVVDRVLRSVHGVIDRPPLGDSPKYASLPAAQINGLDRIDSLVLKAAGDEAVRDCGTGFTTLEFLASVTEQLSVTEAQAIESLEVLDNVDNVKIHRTPGIGVSGMRTFELTSSGLETYLIAYVPTYPKIEKTVLARLADWPEDQGTERKLSDTVGAPRLIVQHVLDQCVDQGLLKVSKPTWDLSGVYFFGVSPRLRRLANL